MSPKINPHSATMFIKRHCSQASIHSSYLPFFLLSFLLSFPVNSENNEKVNTEMEGPSRDTMAPQKPPGPFFPSAHVWRPWLKIERWWSCHLRQNNCPDRPQSGHPSPPRVRAAVRNLVNAAGLYSQRASGEISSPTPGFFIALVKLSQLWTFFPFYFVIRGSISI